MIHKCILRRNNDYLKCRQFLRWQKYEHSSIIHFVNGRLVMLLDVKANISVIVALFGYAVSAVAADSVG